MRNEVQQWVAVAAVAVVALVALFIADSVVGQQGPRGLAGIDGTNGVEGLRGEDGQQGERGPRGRQGLPGVVGLDGKDGIDGRDGDTGVVFLSIITEESTDMIQTATLTCPGNSRVLYGDSRTLLAGFMNPPWLAVDWDVTGIAPNYTGFSATWYDTREPDPDRMAWSLQIFALCLDASFIVIQDDNVS